MCFFWGVFLVTLVDQASKLIIQKNMVLRESIPVINGIFHITYIQNPNSAFGLFKFKNTIFILIALLVILVIFYFFRRSIMNGNRTIFFAFIFILGGSIGNMIDRVRLGSVIDFIDFRIWPIFNIADTALNIGLFLLVIHFLFQQKDDAENKQEY